VTDITLRSGVRVHHELLEVIVRAIVRLRSSNPREESVAAFWAPGDISNVTMKERLSRSASRALKVSERCFMEDFATKA